MGYNECTWEIEKIKQCKFKENSIRNVFSRENKFTLVGVIEIKNIFSKII